MSANVMNGGDLGVPGNYGATNRGPNIGSGEEQFEVISYDDIFDKCGKSPSNLEEVENVKLTHGIGYTEENLLGQRVELKWSSGKWYRGTICDFKSKLQKHRVVYDDGDEKWYNLSEMVFRFVKDTDEWVKL